MSHRFLTLELKFDKTWTIESWKRRFFQDEHPGNACIIIAHRIKEAADDHFPDNGGCFCYYRHCYYFG